MMVEIPEDVQRWERAALKVGEVQVGVDNLGGDGVGVVVVLL